MGYPTLKTFVEMCRFSTEHEVPNEQLVRLLKSGAWDGVIDHPDYDGLRESLAGEQGDLVIRRARALRLDTCGVSIEPPFKNTSIEEDVYGEGDGSFDLADVEPAMLDTSLNLGSAFEAIKSHRAKLSMGERRRRWFIKEANNRALPEDQQRIADDWRECGLVIYFPDTIWLGEDGNRYAGCAYPDDDGWVWDYDWLGLSVNGRVCVLCGK
jgi:hypothetical protein